MPTVYWNASCLFREVSQTMNDTAFEANSGNVQSQLECFGMSKLSIISNENIV